MECDELKADMIEADVVLDTTGLSCPMPLLKTKKTLSSMASGEILEIISTDPGSQRDIPKFGDKGQNEFIGMIDCNGGTFKYYIRKG